MGTDTKTQHRLAIADMCNTGELVPWMQDMANTVAEKLISKYPDIARDEPQKIGAMAKEIVFAYVGAIVADTAEELIAMRDKVGTTL